jgi:hypothetical protein
MEELREMSRGAAKERATAFFFRSTFQRLLRYTNFEIPSLGGRTFGLLLAMQ